jgi:hypothetical protein
MEILQLLCSCRCPLANTPKLEYQLNYSSISSQPFVTELNWTQWVSVWVWVLHYDRRLVGQSVLESSTYLGLTTTFLLLWDSWGFVVWGAVSDERTGLSFTVAAGPRQRSHFRVRVVWDSWSYFTVSDSRLPFGRLLRLARSRWRYAPPHCCSCPGYNFSARSTQKTSFFYYCMCIRCHGNVFTELLPRNGLCLFAHVATMLLLLKWLLSECSSGLGQGPVVSARGHGLYKNRVICWPAECLRKSQCSDNTVACKLISRRFCVTYRGLSVNSPVWCK